MGFPVGYTEVFSPKLFLHALSLLDFIRNLIFTLFHCLGLSDFIETEMVWSDASQIRVPINPSISAIVIRQLLPVIKFEEIVSCSADGDPPESCSVCLDEFGGEEEIRCLTNCKHIFHRACLDRWIDHDHKTCPLCRTLFVPDCLQSEFNRRLWVASGIIDFDADQYGLM